VAILQWQKCKLGKKFWIVEVPSGNGGERHLKEYVWGKLIIHLFFKFKILNFYGAIFFSLAPLKDFHVHRMFGLY
jgi:hypothetical protein